MSNALFSPGRYAREEASARGYFGGVLAAYSTQGAVAVYDELADRATLSFPAGCTRVFAGEMDEHGSPYPISEVLKRAREEFGPSVAVDVATAVFGETGAQELGRDEEGANLAFADQGIEVSDFGTGNYSVCLHLLRVSQKSPEARLALAEGFFAKAAIVSSRVDLDEEEIYQRAAAAPGIDQGEQEPHIS